MSRTLRRLLSLLVASRVFRGGKKEFPFLLTQFRMSGARAFMRELYTRFLEAVRPERKRKEILFPLFPLVSSYFPEFPFDFWKIFS